MKPTIFKKQKIAIINVDAHGAGAFASRYKLLL